MSLRSLIPRSLKARLLWAAVVTMPLIIIFAGVALQRAFYNSLLVSEQTQAQLHIYLLLGDAEMRDGQLWMPASLLDPRFGQVRSGLYGVVHNESGELLWRSPSAQLLPEDLLGSLSQVNLQPGQIRFRHLEDVGMFLFQYPLVWDYRNKELHFLVSILHDDSGVQKQLNAFARQLWGWLSGVLVLVVLLQFVILRWGLRPLDRLARDLRRIEKGKEERLRGEYPQEVQAVTDNLNRLIQSERQQRERYRNTLGDLAHSLKTPLAVIHGAGSEQQTLDNYRQLVDEQTQRMGQIVQYQLARAVRAQGKVLSKPVEIEPIISRIARALEKVYARKEMAVTLEIKPELRFGGDERDLMEVLGNLMENAFKYGLSEVQVTACQEGEWVVVDVADDGPSVSPERRHAILERGARLDSSTPGQGLGLSVAMDIVSSYDGALEVSDSELGGANFRVQLPAYS